MPPTDKIPFDPRALFIRSLPPDGTAEYRKAMLAPMIQSAAVGVIAEMTRSGRSREELNGALVCLDLLMNFCEPTKPKSALPVHPLPSHTQPAK